MTYVSNVYVIKIKQCKKAQFLD